MDSQPEKDSISSPTTSKILEATFDGKTGFLTGATGMLGTALLVRITLDTSIEGIFVLVRGGSGLLTRPIVRHLG